MLKQFRKSVPSPGPIRQKRVYGSPMGDSKRTVRLRRLQRALAGAPDRRHMSLVARPYDNAKAEGSMKTLKAE
jgi:hypothetical protein